MTDNTYEYTILVESDDKGSEYARLKMLGDCCAIDLATAKARYDRGMSLLHESRFGWPSQRALGASYEQWATDYDNAHTWPDGEQVDG